MKISIIVPTCKSELEIAPLVCDLQGFADDTCEVIAICKKESAAVNRNEGLAKATGDIIIMVDDDMAGFYEGWWKDLIKPFHHNVHLIVISARLTNKDGTNGPMMFCGDPKVNGITLVPRVPTACIAFRRCDLTFNDYKVRFNEDFIGSGFEDDDFCAKLSYFYPHEQCFVINNDVRLIHINEMKNQTGKYYTHNKNLFETLWQTSEYSLVRKPLPDNSILYYDNNGKLIKKEESPCTTASTPKTDISMNTSSKENETASSLNVEQSTESSPVTPSSSSGNSGGEVSAVKRTRKSSKSSKKTESAIQ